MSRADLYVSPHLDDVVLSLGGYVRRSTVTGVKVTVATVFAAPIPMEPVGTFAQRCHKDMGGVDSPDMRIREDIAAVRSLGADVLHLPFADCLYRVGPDGGPLVSVDTDVYRDDVTPEQHLVTEVAEQIRNLVTELRPTNVFAPLAVRSHRDHVIARQAVELAVRRIEPAPPVCYYEDVPYVLHVAGDVRRYTTDLVGEVLSLSEEDLGFWSRACACYRSQLGFIWPPSSDFFHDLSEYSIATGAGEPAVRVWRVPESGQLPE